MDQIDLDAIISKMEDEREDYDLSNDFMKVCMKEAIHQALVLASEKATATAILTHYDHNSYIGVVDKQSILDVEKLIK
jgi:hypothetical protein